MEWLGAVPRHWEVDRLKRSTVSTKNGVWGDEAKQDTNDIACVRVADFNRQALRVQLDEPTIRNIVDSERVGRVLVQGDLLLEKSGGGEGQPVGCVVLYDDPLPAVCSNFVARVQTAPGMASSFWRYVHAAAYSVRLNTRSIKQTSGIQNLDASQYFDERAGFPPLSEQIQIATFLDRETAKIDELVAEQRRLMALLKEKRQAVISHAVTRGLNPKAPMKRSGVEWLGEVPAHWQVCSLRRIVSMQSGESITGETIHESGDFPVFGGNGLRGYTADFTHDGHYALIGRQGALCGNVNYASGKFWASEHAVVVTPVKQTEVIWLGELLRAMNLNQYSVAAAQPGLSVDLVGRIGICVPPLPEQTQITAFLDRETAQIDGLISAAEHAIDLLAERRTALISAAVTGQIDVRTTALGKLA